nr:D-alanyl-D-alanine carboxypeptidase [Clostridia bacterium]
MNNNQGNRNFRPQNPNPGNYRQINNNIPQNRPQGQPGGIPRSPVYSQQPRAVGQRQTMQNRMPQQANAPQTKRRKANPLIKKLTQPAKPKPKPRKPRYRTPEALPKPKRRFTMKPISARHSSLGALIALSVMFVSIVTAVGLGVNEKNERYVVDSTPSFSYEYSKLLMDAPHDAMPKVDMTDYAEILSAQIYSETALLMDLSSGIILAQKDPDKIIFPASLTKIMTGIIAIEKLTDLEEKYMFTDEIFITLRGQNASVAGFDAWETVTIRDLIYGVMLPSGAEASVAVAELIAGSEADFAEVMNEKAKELGMENTHFVNATGLHHDDHYTTATDIARLLDYSLKNELFYEVFTSRDYTTTRTSKHPTGITFSSTVFRYIRAEGHKNKYIIGGKTGFTTEGRQCLASIATDGEFEYILVTTGAGDGSNKPYYNVQDALYIYDRYLKD